MQQFHGSRMVDEVMQCHDDLAFLIGRQVEDFRRVRRNVGRLSLQRTMDYVMLSLSHESILPSKPRDELILAEIQHMSTSNP